MKVAGAETLLILQKLEELQALTAPEFVDVDRSELVTGNAAREAWRKGELRLFRVGKKLLAKTAELHRWIETKEERPTLAAVPPVELDDVDEALGAGGVRRTG